MQGSKAGSKAGGGEEDRDKGPGIAFLATTSDGKPAQLNISVAGVRGMNLAMQLPPGQVVYMGTAVLTQGFGGPLTEAMVRQMLDNGLVTSATGAQVKTLFKLCNSAEEATSLF